MMNKTKNQITIKINIQLLNAGDLTLVVAILIYEIKFWCLPIRLLKTILKLLLKNRFLTYRMYEQKSLSKLALQKKDSQSFTPMPKKLIPILLP